jgi:hypothetical protein
MNSPSILRAYSEANDTTARRSPPERVAGADTEALLLKAEIHSSKKGATVYQLRSLLISVGRRRIRMNAGGWRRTLGYYDER